MRPSYTEHQAHLHIPKTPSIFATPSPPIATAINTATRSQHTSLNHLIIARLPLALPPYTTTPLLYTIGISAFAQIYIAFEEAWLRVLAEKSETGAHADAETPARLVPEPELRQELAHLLNSHIRRSEALERDLAHLHHVLRTRDPDETDALASAHAALKLSTAFKISSIRAAIAARPHVVVAYAWVMYMALFSGGRWIRMVLGEAGGEFWGHQRSETGEGVGNGEAGAQEQEQGQEQEKGLGQGQAAGFSFLTFSGEHDGEDVKAEFKQQLARVEERLSDKEKGEIVEEARRIFEGCIALVHELDDVVAAGPGGQNATENVKVEARSVRQVVKVEPLHAGKTSTMVQWLLVVVACLALVVVLAPGRRTALLGNLAVLLPTSGQEARGG